MIPKDRLCAILDRLLERSRADQVRWQQVVGREMAYRVRFPGSAVEVQHRYQSSGPDVVSLSVSNAEGEIIASLQAVEGDEDWALLGPLHMEAERCVLKWDKTLEDIERSLEAQGPVGEEPRPDAPSQSNIPF